MPKSCFSFRIPGYSFLALLEIHDRDAKYVLIQILQGVTKSPKNKMNEEPSTLEQQSQTFSLFCSWYYVVLWMDRLGKKYT